MLNTHKLLYILPDVTYVTELLPTKKPHTFSIHSFRQVNGEFMTEEENVLAENITKLFSKLEPGEYRLVLPDFLFTNTIISIPAGSDAKIASHLKETLLPSLDITTVSHQVSSTKLTEFKGTAKVQLSAIEKSLITPFKVAAADHDISIAGIYPLSWTIKAMVSLEPSISVLQIGSKLYTAFHYIGVDQATITEVTDVDAVVETIKTLKGTEPSIQTIYLLSNSLVEEELKDKISDTLPVQQLASFKEENSQMPSYVKSIIESGMKTLSIEDYPVPKFKVGKPTEEDRTELEALIAEQGGASIKKDQAVSESENNENSEGTVEGEHDKQDIDVEHGLPKPKPISLNEPHDSDDEDESQDESEEEDEDDIEVVSNSDVDEEDDIDLDELEKVEDEDIDETPALKKPTTISQKTETTYIKISDLDDEPTENDDDSEGDEAEKPKSGHTLSLLNKVQANTITLGDEDELKPNLKSPKLETSASDNDDDNIDLEQFVAGGETKVSQTKQPIKNKTGASGMLKMIFITVCVFFLTVAIGVGVGYLVLNWSNNNEPQSPQPSPTPVVQVTPSPVPTLPAADSASDSADTTAVDPAKLSILIVNATSKAGYAGTTKSKLDAAKVGTTKATNAKGEYKAGTYVLITEEDKDLIKSLEDTTDLDLEYSDEQTVEDPSEQYDAVIVLAK